MAAILKSNAILNYLSLIFRRWGKTKTNTGTVQQKIKLTNKDYDN